MLTERFGSTQRILAIEGISGWEGGQRHLLNFANQGLFEKLRIHLLM